MDASADDLEEWPPGVGSLAGGIRLSVTEVDACFELLGLGQTPPLLQLPSPGRDAFERHRHLDAVLRSLRRHDQADHNGPTARLQRLLQILAQPDHQLDLIRHSGSDHALIAIGASTRTYGAIAVRQGEHVTLAPIRNTELGPAIVNLIGPIAPGPGASVSIPADQFDAAWNATPDRRLSTFADHLIAMGIPRSDAATTAHMCRGIRGLGQLGSVRYSQGNARLGPWTIGFHHSNDGYYLQLRRSARYQGETVTISPLTRRRVTQLAQDLLTAPHVQRVDR